ncbi:MAG: hypothetical protein KC535_02350 [Nanoarchaeota archaeon]|nr:hypothetical protein [Nanoarchaeota archaeon]
MVEKEVVQDIYRGFKTGFYEGIRNYFRPLKQHPKLIITGAVVISAIGLIYESSNNHSSTAIDQQSNQGIELLVQPDSSAVQDVRRDTL